jgi:hypothetical protein
MIEYNIFSAGYVRRGAISSAFVMIRVDLDVLLPFSGNIIFREYCFDRAFIHTQATVNAGVRINVKLRGLGKGSLILFGVDAVNRADCHARGIFGANTWLSDNMRHSAKNS